MAVCLDLLRIGMMMLGSTITSTMKQSRQAAIPPVSLLLQFSSSTPFLLRSRTVITSSIPTSVPCSHIFKPASIHVTSICQVVIIMILLALAPKVHSHHTAADPPFSSSPFKRSTITSNSCRNSSSVLCSHLPSLFPHGNLDHSTLIIVLLDSFSRPNLQPDDTESPHRRHPTIIPWFIRPLFLVLLLLHVPTQSRMESTTTTTGA